MYTYTVFYILNFYKIIIKIKNITIVSKILYLIPATPCFTIFRHFSQFSEHFLVRVFLSEVQRSGVRCFTVLTALLALLSIVVCRSWPLQQFQSCFTYLDLNYENFSYWFCSSHLYDSLAYHL
jgi:hypothetical protein